MGFFNPAPGSGGTGEDGRTILSGSGAPSAALGAEGDFYIDTTADAIYGPKASGAWGSATSLIGPQGPPGSGLASVDGVSNSGGNVDFVAGSGMTITPDDTANTVTFAASGGSAATESASGIAEIATQGEADAGTDDSRIVTPLKLAGRGFSRATDLASTSDDAKGDALVGVKQPFTGSVARTQHAKNAEWLHVKDFGAVGNGTTDDSSALQAAILAAEGAKANLDWGSGVYAISTGLRFRVGIRHRGAGAGDANTASGGLQTPACALKWTGSNSGTTSADVMAYVKAGTQGDHVHRFSWEGIAFLGNDGAYRAMEMQSTRQATVHFVANRCRDRGLFLNDGNYVQTNLTNSTTLPQSTITLDSTANLAASGNVALISGSNVVNVAYTGISGNTITGCTTSSTLTFPAASVVRQACLSAHNELAAVSYTPGSDAATQGSTGLSILNTSRITAGDSGVTNTEVTGLVQISYNAGDGIEIGDHDTGNFGKYHATPLAGATGKSVRFRGLSGFVVQPRPARKNFFFYISCGDIYSEGDGTVDASARNGAAFVNSESTSVTTQAGAIFHYTAIDRNHGDLFFTHRYRMSDQYPVPLALGKAQAGTPARSSIGAIDVESVSFPDSATGTWAVTFHIPYDWNVGRVTGVRITSTLGAVASGDIVVQTTVSARGPTEGLGSGNVINSATLTGVANNVVHDQTVTVSPVLAVEPGDTLTVKIARLGSNVGDTNTAAWHALGVSLVYLSAGPDSDTAYSFQTGAARLA